MLTRIFWALLVIDIGGLAVLAVLSAKGPSSPEGAVGGWLIFIPPIVMMVLVALVLITRSDAAKLAGIAVLGFPWIPVVVGPVYSALQDYQSERRLAGDDDFRGAQQRKLAHAIKAHDAQLAKSLIPLAGDLNIQYRKDTLLEFAVSNASDSISGPVPAASLEIVQALLDAGANADQRLAPNGIWPLTSAIFTGPELTEMLLKAGANPNHLDDADRPLWWQVLSDDTDRGIQTLLILLNHGADLTIRDHEGGPVGWAAYHARAKYNSSWRGVLLLVEHGAAWKDEKEFSQTVADMLSQDYEDRGHPGREITEEMRKLHVMYFGH